MNDYTNRTITQIRKDLGTEKDEGKRNANEGKKRMRDKIKRKKERKVVKIKIKKKETAKKKH